MMLGFAPRLEHGAQQRGFRLCTEETLGGLGTVPSMLAIVGGRLMPVVCLAVVLTLQVHPLVQ